jgi:hypothetical protein
MVAIEGHFQPHMNLFPSAFLCDILGKTTTKSYKEAGLA